MDPPDVVESKEVLCSIILEWALLTGIHIFFCIEIKLQLENPKEYVKLFERKEYGRKRKAEKEPEEESKTLRYDVYQHHQLANVWVHQISIKLDSISFVNCVGIVVKLSSQVYFNPDTGKIRVGKGRLENFFENPNVPQLVIF